MFGVALTGCGSGGGASNALPSAPASSPAPGAPPPAPPATLGLTACTPSGKGEDYQVGTGAGQLTSLDQVPWEALAAGDTVRIFYKATPYTGKFLITASGTATSPVRVCGVKGPHGERPIISGSGAITRRSLVYGNASSAAIQEARSVVMIKADADEYTAFPSYIQIDGLAIRSAHPNYTYTDTGGVKHPYDAFGACIWVDRGHNITIADNEISDCTNGLFSKSTDDGDFAVSKNLRIAGNYIHGNGVVGDEHEHNTYLQSVGVVVEFNHYGPPRTGSGGNALKDRSVGLVVRYNRFEEGARALDLVEAEDFPVTATADPAYRTTFVYGNQIIKSGDTGSFIHYGGDHSGSTPGANWGEPLFRKGTLYFFSNTIVATGSEARLFQLSTTEEHAEIWNNVLYFAPTVTYPSLRADQEVGDAWVNGGVLNLGRNWINADWADSDPFHSILGQVLGVANLLTGNSPPLDRGTLVPLPGSVIVDAAVAGPSAAAAYTVDFQLDGSNRPVTRSVRGVAADLGAVER